LEANLAIDTEKQKFMSWREGDIDFIKRRGWNCPIIQHQIDGGVDTTRRSVRVTNDVVEAWHVGADLFWTRTAFIAEFKQAPEAAGYTVETKEFADGSSLTGYRTKDDGKRPLPEGCISIGKTMECRVGNKRQIDQDDSMGMTKDHLGSVAKGYATRFLGTGGPGDDVPHVPIDTLRSLAGKQVSPVSEGGKKSKIEGAGDDPSSPASGASSLPPRNLVDVMAQWETAQPCTNPEGAPARGKKRFKQPTAMPPTQTPPPIKQARTGGGRNLGGTVKPSKPGKASKAGASAVGTIKDEITVELNNTMVSFSNDTKLEDMSTTDSAISGCITKWGKKKGALISCNLLDDVDEVVSIIGVCTLVRKILAAFKFYVESNKPSAANQLMAVLSQWDKTDTLQVA